MSAQFPPNNDEFVKQLMAAASKVNNRFNKIRCGFCGIKFYPSEHLPKYCTYTCNIMSAEIRGAMVSVDAYKVVKKFDENAIEWQKTMAVLEEEYKKEQAKLLEEQKMLEKELNNKELEKIEPKMSLKGLFLDLNSKGIK